MSNTNDEEMLRRLENASPEEAKELVIQSIHPACREVGRGFFTCIENKFAVYENKGLDLKDLEREFNEVVSPACMAEFDLESCLKSGGL